MKLSELVEAKAREAAFAMVHDTECIWTNSIDDEPVYSEGSISDRIKDSLIAILTDPQVGFKEALERGRSLSKAGDSLFHEIDELMGDTDPIEDDDATLACQEWWKALHEFESIAAETKLAELQEMEKGI